MSFILQGFLIYLSINDKTTCCASKKPAMAGTQATLPGMLRRPGGGSSGCSGLKPSSSLYTTV